MCTPTNTFNRGKEDFTNDLEKSTKEADTKTFEIPAHSRRYSKLADARTALVGLEPTNLGVKVPCLAAWLKGNVKSSAHPQPRYRQHTRQQYGAEIQ